MNSHTAAQLAEMQRQELTPDTTYYRKARAHRGSTRNRSWGFQPRVSSPSDPRLQRFVDKFRASPAFTPEYGGECTRGVGTPQQT